MCCLNGDVGKVWKNNRKLRKPTKKNPGSKNSYKGGLGLQYRLPARVVLYKKVELGQPFCIYIHFVVVSFQILICILYLYISDNYKMFTETMLVGTLDGIGPTTKYYWENSCQNF